jgi:hypothetical protein
MAPSKNLEKYRDPFHVETQNPATHDLGLGFLNVRTNESRELLGW